MVCPPILPFTFPANPIPQPSPFSCFSTAPGYDATLPRSHAARLPLSQLAFDDTSSSHPPGFTTTFDDWERKRLSTSPGGGDTGKGGARVGKRKGYGGRRLSKDLIGSPTNFVHLQHVDSPRPVSVGVAGGAGGPGGMIVTNLKEKLASITAALQSSKPPSSPTFNDPPPLPIPSSAPRISPKKAALTTLPPRRARPLSVSRKPAPPITASVIRQAGPRAVLESATTSDAAVGLLPLATVSAFRVNQGILLWKEEDEVEVVSADGKEDKEASPAIDGVRTGECEKEAEVEDAGEKIEGGSGRGWEKAMREIEAALSLPSPSLP